jgi:hypothetical protein
MDEQQSVTFTMTADDHVAGARLSVLRVLKRPFRPLTIVGMVCIVLLIAVAVVQTVRSGQLSLASLVGFAPLAAFGLLLYFVTAPSAVRRNFKYNKQNHHPMILSWDAGAFDFRSNENRSHIEWADLYRSMENSKVMLFFVSPQIMCIVPKRILTAAQIEQLRHYSHLK